MKVDLSNNDITLTTGNTAGDLDSKDIKSIDCKITISGVQKSVKIDANKKVTVSDIAKSNG